MFPPLGKMEAMLEEKFLWFLSISKFKRMERVGEDMEDIGMFLSCSYGRQREPGTKQWALGQGDLGR